METAGVETTGREQVVASFDTYAEAARAVESLAVHDFPVEHVSIVGRGLAVVEEVTGRRSVLDAAVDGALWTALSGGFLGLVFGAVGTPFGGFALMLWGAVAGLLIGAILGALAHNANGRHVSSLSGLRAERFDVLVAAPYADDAAALIDDVQRPRRPL